MKFDNQKLIEYTRAADCRDTLRYEHQRTPRLCSPSPTPSPGVAFAVSMSRGHLYRLVEGSAIPRMDLIEALARYFKVPPSYFLDGNTALEETINKVDIVLADVDTFRSHRTV